MKRAAMAVAIGVILGFACFGRAWAGEVDVLVNKLVEKGVISASDAQIILDETAADVAKQNAKGENNAIPAWIQTIKLGGDFRLRYEYKQDKGTVETNRPRFRLRLNLEDQVNDKVKVGVTLATGSTTAGASATRSNNQSFQDEFAKKPFAIDKAFVDYAPKSWVDIIGGKMANPIWEPMSFVWDPDITPEGAAVKFKNKFSSNLDWFVNTGIFTLQNSATQHNPVQAFVQPGVEWRPIEKTTLKADANYYQYWNVKSYPLLTGGSTTAGNTLDAGNTYRYNYNAVNPTLQLELDDPLKRMGINMPTSFDIPYLCMFGSFLKNVDVAKGGKAYIGGIKFGNKSIAKFGDWQFNYCYKVLGKDSILDILPDDDFNGGLTNSRGNAYFLEYGLGKNTSLKLNYYRAWRMAPNQVPEDHFMLDFNFKF